MTERKKYPDVHVCARNVEPELFSNDLWFEKGLLYIAKRATFTFILIWKLMRGTNDMLTNTIVGSPTTFLPRWGNYELLFCFECFGKICTKNICSYIEPKHFVCMLGYYTLYFIRGFIISCYHDVFKCNLNTMAKTDIFFVKRVIITIIVEQFGFCFIFRINCWIKWLMFSHLFM